jgi:hypothetical protein
MPSGILTIHQASQTSSLLLSYATTQPAEHSTLRSATFYLRPPPCHAGNAVGRPTSPFANYRARLKSAGNLYRPGRGSPGAGNMSSTASATQIAC